MITRSVISRTRRRGVEPVAGQHIGDVVDEIVVVEVERRDVHRDRELGGRGHRLSHRRPAQQASSSTERPSATISPLSSITEMNSPGARIPRSGCTQRTSASMPTRRPVGDRELGLVVQDELVAVDGAAQLRLEVEPRE